MTVTYAKEPFDSFFSDAQALLRAHWDEIAKMKHMMKLAPDVDRYRSLERQGILHIMTARDDGRLVGYFPVLVNRNLHYPSVTVGSDDVYFVAPEYRKRGVGIRLFVETEKMIRALKAHVMVVKEKIGHSHAPLLERLGFLPTETVYWKSLEGDIPSIPLNEGTC